MAIQTRSKSIGNFTYHVRQLGASEGRRMLVRLVRVLGPVLGALLDGPPGKDGKPTKVKPTSILDADTAVVSKALTELAARLTEADLDAVCVVFGMTTQVELDAGRMVPLDKERQELHWAGKYGEMFRWLGFCLEVNYSDFFASFTAQDSVGGRGETAPAE